MATTFVRVTGTALESDTRSGIARASQEPYTLRSTHVLVADRGITDVTLPDRKAFPPKGELIDWLCELRVGRTGQLNVTCVGDYDQLVDSAA